MVTETLETTQEEKDAQDFGNTLRMTPDLLPAKEPKQKMPTSELKVITQFTQPLSTKLNLYK